MTDELDLLYEREFSEFKELASKFGSDGQRVIKWCEEAMNESGPIGGLNSILHSYLCARAVPIDIVKAASISQSLGDRTNIHAMNLLSELKGSFDEWIRCKIQLGRGLINEERMGKCLYSISLRDISSRDPRLQLSDHIGRKNLNRLLAELLKKIDCEKDVSAKAVMLEGYAISNIRSISDDNLEVIEKIISEITSSYDSIDDPNGDIALELAKLLMMIDGMPAGMHWMDVSAIKGNCEALSVMIQIENHTSIEKWKSAVEKYISSGVEWDMIQRIFENRVSHCGRSVFPFDSLDAIEKIIGSKETTAASRGIECYLRGDYKGCAERFLELRDKNQTVYALVCRMLYYGEGVCKNEDLAHEMTASYHITDEICEKVAEAFGIDIGDYE